MLQADVRRAVEEPDFDAGVNIVGTIAVLEAARAVGMTEGKVMRLVLLPQAFRIMLPALISQLVVILKDTSLGAFIAYLELTSRNLAARSEDQVVRRQRKTPATGRTTSNLELYEVIRQAVVEPAHNTPWFDDLANRVV